MTVKELIRRLGELTDAGDLEVEIARGEYTSVIVSADALAGNSGSPNYVFLTSAADIDDFGRSVREALGDSDPDPTLN